MQSPNMIELQALSLVQGPRLTQLEIDTQILLDERSAALRKVNETKEAVKRQRIEHCLQQIDRVASIESLRAATWNRATVAQRRIACMCANLPKERADDALTKFDAFERTKIWTALDDLVDGLVNIKKCMTGGIVPPQNNYQ